MISESMMRETLGNLFTLVSDTRSTHFLSLSNVSVSETRVVKPFLGAVYLGLCPCVVLIYFQCCEGLMFLLFKIKMCHNETCGTEVYDGNGMICTLNVYW